MLIKMEKMEMKKKVAVNKFVFNFVKDNSL